ncbi:RE1, partial [Symbiodinium microadriaticum]
MWLLRCSETFELLAVLSIYVDDLLLSGTTEASEAIWTAIKAKWRISEPEYADLGKSVTFCGFEIQQKSDGLHVGQSKYIQSLLDKYPEIQGTTTCPYAKENEIIETKPNASLEKLRRAQALVGEMLWLATRTRVDLSFGVSRIGQLITKDVDQAIQRGEDMIRYLRSTKTQEIVYGSSGKGHGPGEQLPEQRDFNLVEVFADASFCPGTDRSQSGIIMLWGNAPVGWMSMRQPCASLSTAEAELQASLDGMTLAEGLYGLLEELAEAPQKAFLYNDNVGACTVLIRAVRENPDDESEWSVVQSAPEGVDVKDEDKDDDRVGLKATTPLGGNRSGEQVLLGRRTGEILLNDLLAVRLRPMLMEMFRSTRMLSFRRLCLPDRQAPTDRSSTLGGIFLRRRVLRGIPSLLGVDLKEIFTSEYHRDSDKTSGSMTFDDELWFGFMRSRGGKCFCLDLQGGPM